MPPTRRAGGDPVKIAYPATLVPMAHDASNIDGTVIKTGEARSYISVVGAGDFANRRRLGSAREWGAVPLVLKMQRRSTPVMLSRLNP